MTITNQTNSDLSIMGDTLKPNETRNFLTSDYDDITIFANDGFCNIKITGGIRTFYRCGSIGVKQNSKKDTNGEKIIIIYESI